MKDKPIENAGEHIPGSVVLVPEGLRVVAGNPNGMQINFRGTRPASGFWNAMKWLVGIRVQVVAREVTFCRYAIAEELLRDGTGWRLAPEEDTNHRFGWVWLERDAPGEQDHGRIA